MEIRLGLSACQLVGVCGFRVACPFRYYQPFESRMVLAFAHGAERCVLPVVDGSFCLYNAMAGWINAR